MRGRCQGRLVAPAAAWQAANVGHLAVAVAVAVAIADAVAVAIAVALLTFFDSGPKTKTARGLRTLPSSPLSLLSLSARNTLCISFFLALPPPLAACVL